MLTALDATAGTLTELERAFVEAVREDGFFDMHVDAAGDLPGFSYTTGFYVSTGQPEFVIFGVSRGVAHDVFWDLFRAAQSGTLPPVGEPTDAMFEGYPAYLLPVDVRRYQERLDWCRWFYGGDAFPCLQIVWPDRGGRLPWQPEYEAHDVGVQADLTGANWAQALRSR